MLLGNPQLKGSMANLNIWILRASVVLTLFWCVWFLVGIVGHAFPAFGIQQISFPPTDNWPEGHQVFPAFDFVGQPLTSIIAVIALALPLSQLLALLFQNKHLGVIVGIFMLLIGLPIVFQLVPFGKIDPAHDFVWDTCFPIFLHGSFLYAGVVMIVWSKRNTKKSELQQIAT